MPVGESIWSSVRYTDMRVTYRLVQLAQTLVATPDDKHWGYQLMHDTGIPSGVVYPLLSRMHEDGWLKMHTDKGPSTLGPARRYYTLTVKGRKELDLIIQTAKDRGLV